MDVVFFGSGAFGLPTLERLARDHRVSAVVTQPDRKAGRGAKLTPTPIGAWAGEHLQGAPLLKPERVSEPEIIDQVRAYSADAWVIIAYGQKLPPALLADRFAINLHASLLPRWRGAAPINWAILEGDAETGNSVITLADRMDAGLVLGQSRRTIEPSQTTGELHDLLAADGPELVLSVLADHEAGRVQAKEQDESLVTHARKLSREDSQLDWSQSAEQVSSRINGLSPWPGAVSMFEDQRLKLMRSRSIRSGEDLLPHKAPAFVLGEGLESEYSAHWPRLREENNFRPGVLVHEAWGIVCTGDGLVQILEVQPPNKPVMTWEDFSNGRGLKHMSFHAHERELRVFESATC